MDRVDDEFRARRGTTVSDTSMKEEADPSNKAQDLDQVKRKLKAETAREGGGVVGGVKAAFHHADRELAGEYERREDPDARRNPDAPMREQQPPEEGRQ
ncbi:MAG: hypothetical protein E6I76_04770 [Chloroflexi bacterium]|nr:MAG: hypothetical protein E6I76_04770 [Chloroflexota bacterium]